MPDYYGVVLDYVVDNSTVYCTGQGKTSHRTGQAAALQVLSLESKWREHRIECNTEQRRGTGILGLDQKKRVLEDWGGREWTQWRRARGCRVVGSWVTSAVRPHAKMIVEPETVPGARLIGMLDVCYTMHFAWGCAG